MGLYLTNGWLVVLIAIPVSFLIVMRLVGKRLWRRLPDLSQERRRTKLGLCHACGYNLKGVESYQCPECGTVRMYPARKLKSRVEPEKM
jgi:predicted RNA-binding Zn-ribbon protein involved in translation (DUF1610 family)